MARKTWDELRQRLVDSRYRIAESATYTPQTGNAIDLKVIVEPSIAVLGDFGQVLDTRTEIGVLAADVPEWKRGDTIEARGRTWTVQGLDESRFSEHVHWLIVS